MTTRTKLALPFFAIALATFGCGSDDNNSGGSGGDGGTAGSSEAGASAGGVANGGEAGGGAENGGSAGGGTGGESLDGTGGVGGSSGESAGGDGGESGSAGAGGDGAGGMVNNVPVDYQGTPYKALQIPGKIYAADYDRGGPGVAYCHGNPNDCQAGVNTGDWAPAEGGNGPVYREPPMPNDQICGGAACNDNVGLCRMSPAKPDKTTTGAAVTPQDTYICYVATNEWLKYTVQVAEAGTYSISGFMAAPGGVNISLDFGDGVTTNTFPLPESPTNMCGCTESYHSWATNPSLATVTFPAAGTYLMTFTIHSQQFNADWFEFTKM